MLAAVVAFAGISFNAEAGTQPHKGVIRVKLQPEMALQLGQTPRMQTHGGVVTTGITPLDRASRAQIRAAKGQIRARPLVCNQLRRIRITRRGSQNLCFHRRCGTLRSNHPDVAQGRRQRIPQTRPDRSPGESGSKHAVQRPFPAKAVAL